MSISLIVVLVALAKASLVMRKLPADSYPLGKELASGKTGMVYQSRPRGAQHDVAVKQQAVVDEQLVREVEFLKQMEDDEYCGLPRLFDVYQVDERPHLVLQLFNGKEMRELPRPYNEDQIMMILFKVVAVLERVHARGYVHGDLSLQNILIGDNGDVMVLDWSGMKMDGDVSDRHRVDVLPMDMMMTTMGYTAPELTREQYGYPSDIYSLGRCVEMLKKIDPTFEIDGRLARFVDAVKKRDSKSRLTASELLDHEMFAKERCALLDDAVRSDDDLCKIVALKTKANRENFARIPDPVDGTRKLPDWNSPAACARLGISRSLRRTKAQIVKRHVPFGSIVNLTGFEHRNDCSIASAVVAPAVAGQNQPSGSLPRPLAKLTRSLNVTVERDEDSEAAACQ